MSFIQNLFTKILLSNQTFDVFGRWSNLGDSLLWLVTSFWQLIVKGFYYGIVRWVLAFVDFMQYFVQKLIGLDYWLNRSTYTLEGAIESDIIFGFLYNDTVQKVFRALMAVFFVLLIIFTIYAIVRQEWKYITGKEFGNGAGNSKGQIFRESIKAIALVIILPIILMAGIISANAILASLIKALQIDTSSTLGGQLFEIGALNANRYEKYANGDTRSAASDKISFYITPEGKWLKLSSDGAGNPDLEEVVTTYPEFLKRAAESNLYSVNTMFDDINPGVSSYYSRFYGYCAKIKFKDEENFMMFPVSLKSEGVAVGENDHNGKKAVGYYLRNVLQVPIVTKSNSQGFSEYKDFEHIGEDGYINGFDTWHAHEQTSEAFYRTWHYASTYKNTFSFEEGLDYTVVRAGNKINGIVLGLPSSENPDFFGSLGLSITNAKVMYNSNQISQYFDGGQFGMAQMKSEYLVMADVVNFICENNIQLQVMDITSSAIDWIGVGGYAVDTKWVSSSGNVAGQLVNMHTGISPVNKAIPFVVSYSDQCVESEMGNVLYMGYKGVNNEINGAKYIMCIKVNTATGTKYIPLVNNKTYTDPVTGKKYNFKSDYYSSSYKGVVVAKGFLDHNSTDAYLGNPTYLTNGYKNADGEIANLETPYYYDMKNVGGFNQYAVGVGDYYIKGEIQDATVTLSSESTSYLVEPVGENDISNGLYQIKEKKGDSKNIITPGSDIIRELQLRFYVEEIKHPTENSNVFTDVTSLNVTSTATYAGLSNGNKYLFRLTCIGNEFYFIVEVDNINGYVKVLTNTGTDNNFDYMTTELTQSDKLIAKSYLYKLMYDYVEGINKKDVEIKGEVVDNLTPNYFENKSFRDGKAIYSTVDMVSLYKNVDDVVVIEGVSKEKDYKFEKTLYMSITFDTTKTRLVNFGGDGKSLTFEKPINAGSTYAQRTQNKNLQRSAIFSFQLYNQYTAYGYIEGDILNGKLYSYYPNEDNQRSRLVRENEKPTKDDDDFYFECKIDENGFLFPTTDTYLSVYDGNTYVATLYKLAGTQISNLDDLMAKSTYILYDNKIYYNIKSQNSFKGAAGTTLDEMGSDGVTTTDTDVRKAITKHFSDMRWASVVKCVRDEATMDFFAWDWRFHDIFEWYFEIDIWMCGMERNICNKEFLITSGIQFDYFFEGDNNSIMDFYIPSEISYWIMLIAAMLMIKVLGSSIWGVIKRIYEITLLFLASPAVASTIPLDDGKRFKSSIQDPLIKQVMGAYGVMLGLNVFFILLAPVEIMSQVFTAEDIALSNSYFLKNVFSFLSYESKAWLLNKYVYILFVMVAFTMISSVTQTISQMAGGENLEKTGKATKDAAKKIKDDARDTMSGKKLVDGASKLKENIKSGNFIPGGALIKSAFGLGKAGLNKLRGAYDEGANPKDDDETTGEKPKTNKNDEEEQTVQNAIDEKVKEATGGMTYEEAMENGDDEQKAAAQKAKEEAEQEIMNGDDETAKAALKRLKKKEAGGDGEEQKDDETENSGEGGNKPKDKPKTQAEMIEEEAKNKFNASTAAMAEKVTGQKGKESGMQAATVRNSVQTGNGKVVKAATEAIKNAAGKDGKSVNEMVTGKDGKGGLMNEESKKKAVLSTMSDDQKKAFNSMSAKEQAKELEKYSVTAAVGSDGKMAYSVTNSQDGSKKSVDSKTANEITSQVISAKDENGKNIIDNDTINDAVKAVGAEDEVAKFTAKNIAAGIDFGDAQNDAVANEMLKHIMSNTDVAQNGKVLDKATLAFLNSGTKEAESAKKAFLKQTGMSEEDLKDENKALKAISDIRSTGNGLAAIGIDLLNPDHVAKYMPKALEESVQNGEFKMDSWDFFKKTNNAGYEELVGEVIESKFIRTDEQSELEKQKSKDMVDDKQAREMLKEAGIENVDQMNTEQLKKAKEDLIVNKTKEIAQAAGVKDFDKLGEDEKQHYREKAEKEVSQMEAKAAGKVAFDAFVETSAKNSSEVEKAANAYFGINSRQDALNMFSAKEEQEIKANGLDAEALARAKKTLELMGNENVSLNDAKEYLLNAKQDPEKYNAELMQAIKDDGAKPENKDKMDRVYEAIGSSKNIEALKEMTASNGLIGLDNQKKEELMFAVNRDKILEANGVNLSGLTEEQKQKSFDKLTYAQKANAMYGKEAMINDNKFAISVHNKAGIIENAAKNDKEVANKVLEAAGYSKEDIEKMSDSDRETNVKNAVSEMTEFQKQKIYFDQLTEEQRNDAFDGLTDEQKNKGLILAKRDEVFESSENMRMKAVLANEDAALKALGLEGYEGDKQEFLKSLKPEEIDQAFAALSAKERDKAFDDMTDEEVASAANILALNNNQKVLEDFVNGEGSKISAYEADLLLNGRTDENGNATAVSRKDVLNELKHEAEKKQKIDEAVANGEFTTDQIKEQVDQDENAQRAMEDSFNQRFNVVTDAEAEEQKRKARRNKLKEKYGEKSTDSDIYQKITGETDDTKLKEEVASKTAAYVKDKLNGNKDYEKLLKTYLKDNKGKNENDFINEFVNGKLDNKKYDLNTVFEATGEKLNGTGGVEERIREDYVLDLAKNADPTFAADLVEAENKAVDEKNRKKIEEEGAFEKAQKVAKLVEDDKKLNSEAEKLYAQMNNGESLQNADEITKAAFMLKHFGDKVDQDEINNVSFKSESIYEKIKKKDELFDDVFENLSSVDAGGSDEGEQLKENIKRRIVEAEYEKYGGVLDVEADPEKMSEAKRNEFEKNKNILQLQMGGKDDEGRTIGNLFKNHTILGQDAMIADIAKAQGLKKNDKGEYVDESGKVLKNKDGKSITDKNITDLKQHLDNKAIEKYMNSHEQTKDKLVNLGALNLTKALDNETLLQKKMQVISNSPYLQNQVADNVLRSAGLDDGKGKLDDDKIKKLIEEMLKREGKEDLAKDETYIKNNFTQLKNELSMYNITNENGTTKLGDRDSSAFLSAIENLEKGSNTFATKLNQEVMNIAKDPNAQTVDGNMFFQKTESYGKDAQGKEITNMKDAIDIFMGNPDRFDGYGKGIKNMAGDVKGGVTSGGFIGGLKSIFVGSVGENGNTNVSALGRKGDMGGIVGAVENLAVKGAGGAVKKAVTFKAVRSAIGLFAGYNKKYKREGDNLGFGGYLKEKLGFVQYERDENGKIKKDKGGNLIKAGAQLDKDGYLIGSHYERDANGKVRKDDNGEVIIKGAQLKKLGNGKEVMIKDDNGNVMLSKYKLKYDAKTKSYVEDKSQKNENYVKKHEAKISRYKLNNDGTVDKSQKNENFSKRGGVFKAFSKLADNTAIGHLIKHTGLSVAKMGTGIGLGIAKMATGVGLGTARIAAKTYNATIGKVVNFIGRDRRAFRKQDNETLKIVQAARNNEEVKKALGENATYGQISFYLEKNKGLRNQIKSQVYANEARNDQTIKDEMVKAGVNVDNDEEVAIFLGKNKKHKKTIENNLKNNKKDFYDSIRADDKISGEIKKNILSDDEMDKAITEYEKDNNIKINVKEKAIVAEARKDAKIKATLGENATDDEVLDYISKDKKQYEKFKQQARRTAAKEEPAILNSILLKAGKVTSQGSLKTTAIDKFFKDNGMLKVFKQTDSSVAHNFAEAKGKVFGIAARGWNKTKEATQNFFGIFGREGRVFKKHDTETVKMVEAAKKDPAFMANMAKIGGNGTFGEIALYLDKHKDVQKQMRNRVYAEEVRYGKNAESDAIRKQIEKEHIDINDDSAVAAFLERNSGLKKQVQSNIKKQSMTDVVNNGVFKDEFKKNFFTDKELDKIASDKDVKSKLNITDQDVVKEARKSAYIKARLGENATDDEILKYLGDKNSKDYKKFEHEARKTAIRENTNNNNVLNNELNKQGITDGNGKLTPDAVKKYFDDKKALATYRRTDSSAMKQFKDKFGTVFGNVSKGANQTGEAIKNGFTSAGMHILRTFWGKEYIDKNGHKHSGFETSYIARSLRNAKSFINKGLIKAEFYVKKGVNKAADAVWEQVVRTFAGREYTDKNGNKHRAGFKDSYIARGVWAAIKGSGKGFAAAGKGIAKATVVGYNAVIFKAAGKLPKVCAQYENWNKVINFKISQIKKDNKLTRSEKIREIEKLQSQIIHIEKPQNFYNMTTEEKNQFINQQNNLKQQAYTDINLASFVKTVNQVQKAKNPGKVDIDAELTQKPKVDKDRKDKHLKDLRQARDNMERFDNTSVMRNNERDFGDEFEKFAKAYMDDKQYNDMMKRNKLLSQVEYNKLSATQKAKEREKREQAMKTQLVKIERVLTKKVSNDQKVKGYLKSRNLEAEVVRYSYPKAFRETVSSISGTGLSKRQREKQAKAQEKAQDKYLSIQNEALNIDKMMNEFISFNSNYKGKSSDFASEFKKQFAKFGPYAQRIYDKYAKSFKGLDVSLDKRPIAVQQRQIMKDLASELEKQRRRLTSTGMISATSDINNMFVGKTFTNATTKAELKLHQQSADDLGRLLNLIKQQRDIVSFDSLTKRISSTHLSDFMSANKDKLKGKSEEAKKNLLQKHFESKLEKALNLVHNDSKRLSDKDKLTRLNGRMVEKSSINRSKESQILKQAMATENNPVYKTLIRDVNSATEKVNLEKFNLDDLLAKLREVQSRARTPKNIQLMSQINGAIKESKTKLAALQRVLNNATAKKKDFESAFASNQIKQAKSTNRNLGYNKEHSNVFDKYIFPKIDGSALSAMDKKQVQMLISSFNSQYSQSIQGMLKNEIIRNNKQLSKMIQDMSDRFNNDFGRTYSDMNKMRDKLNDQISKLKTSTEQGDKDLASRLSDEVSRMNLAEQTLKDKMLTMDIDISNVRLRK